MEQTQGHDPMPQISTKILEAFAALLNVESSAELKFVTEGISGYGENSYGAVLKVKIEAIKAKADELTRNSPLECVLKIAPKHAARRAFMRVADYYKREVFMYAQVFDAYRRINDEAGATLQGILPHMLAYSLDDCDEFIIFEDLSVQGFTPSFRKELPTFEMVEAALKTLAKFHALSFALQAKEPAMFSEFIAKLQPDNLFTPDISAVSVEFGKSYLRRARKMLDNNSKPIAKATEPSVEMNVTLQMQILSDVEAQFKEIGIRSVDGAACAPYAVICHGDFWINNIMNKFQPTSNKVHFSKLVDFQMSRYASPILDLVHYLFICSEQSMREKHFQHFLSESYYETLSAQLKIFNLNADLLYPRSILHEQLKSHGAYGLCMAAFSLPFFVADQTDLLDLDEVAQSVKDISEGDHAIEMDQTKQEDNNRKVIETYDLLTAKTAPIFKHRMIGIVKDLIRHDIKTKF